MLNIYNSPAFLDRGLSGTYCVLTSVMEDRLPQNKHYKSGILGTVCFVRMANHEWDERGTAQYVDIAADNDESSLAETFFKALLELPR